MTDFRFLTVEQIDDIHSLAIRKDGGKPGLRERDNLEMSAVAPQNLAIYQEVDAFDLAAAYAHSITRNHPYEDGNKRTALTSALVFLGLNGLGDHNFRHADLEQAGLYLTNRQMTRKSFAQYLRDGFDGTPGSWVDDLESQPD